MNPLDKALTNIELLLEKGLIDDETANSLASKAYQDYDELYYNSKIKDTNGDFNQMSSLAEFSAATDTNTFGQYILAIGEELGYDDIYEFVGDLTESFDADPDEIVGILAGEYLPTEEFIESLSDMVEVDQELYDALYDSAAEAYIDSGVVDTVLEELTAEESYDDEYEDDADYDNYYDEEDSQEYDDSAEAGYNDDLALAALQEAREAKYNAAMLQNQMAEFNAIAEVNSALKERERFALDLVSAGKMPPVVFEDLFGNFDSDEDRLAAFSQVCEYNGTDATSELYAIDKQLNTFAAYGDTALFNRHAYDYVDEEVINEELEEYQEALLNRELAEAKKANLI